MPFPYRVNPYVDHAREQLVEWVVRTGLVQRQSALERFTDADFGWFAGMIYPTANADHLALAADWVVWLFLVDDHFDDGLFGRSESQSAQIIDDMHSVLANHDPDSHAFACDGMPTAVSSLAELWRRTTSGATTQCRTRLAFHVNEYLRSAAIWETANRIHSHVPDESTYVEKRRHTGAIYVCMDLIEIVEQLDMPDGLYDDPVFQNALDAACNVVTWTNDVYSLSKERSLGEFHNLVYIMEHNRGLRREEALTRVCAAISSETERFIDLEQQLLSNHAASDAVLRPYLEGMRSWMRGNLDWSRATKRYRAYEDNSAVLPHEYLEAAVTDVHQIGDSSLRSAVQKPVSS
jgi:hypothetical protein